jgi:SAM-dependent methyltransferase
MALHPLAEQFAAVAEVYERGRPDYPPAVIEALIAELGLDPGARVLDLAAGTGKLSRALLAGGVDVVAVEPLAALRELLASAIGPERVVEGVAEAIPLPDGSVTAVTVADAFHWFEPQAALREIGRVLKPSGGLAVVFTAPDWGEAPWGDELAALLSQPRTAHPGIDGPPIGDVLAAAPGWTAPREVRITTRQPASPERMVDYVGSISWVAAMDEAPRAALLERVAELTAQGTPPQLPVHCFMWLTALA